MIHGRYVSNLHLDESWFCHRCQSAQKNPRSTSSQSMEVHQIFDAIRSIDDDGRRTAGWSDVFDDRFGGSPAKSLFVGGNGRFPPCSDLRRCPAGLLSFILDSREVRTRWPCRDHHDELPARMRPDIFWDRLQLLGRASDGASQRMGHFTRPAELPLPSIGALRRGVATSSLQKCRPVAALERSCSRQKLGPPLAPSVGCFPTHHYKL